MDFSAKAFISGSAGLGLLQFVSRYFLSTKMELLGYDLLFLFSKTNVNSWDTLCLPKFILDVFNGIVQFGSNF